jgi:hypothetical protein
MAENAVSKLRELDEIQLAHDILTTVCLGDPYFHYSPGEIQSLSRMADVLCWALRHDHNKRFQAILDSINKRAAQLGYKLGPK